MSTWLYAIGRNEVRRQLGRHPGDSLVSLDAPNAPELTAPDGLDEALERSEDGLRLRKALRRIPAIYRRALVDHFIRGQSVKRIGRRERVPVGTVLSRIFKAKRLLRRSWEHAR